MNSPNNEKKVAKETEGRKREEKRSDSAEEKMEKRARREETPLIEESKKEKKEWMEENKKKRGTMGNRTETRIISKILDVRGSQGDEEYLVEWKNEERSWEPLRNIRGGERSPAVVDFKAMRSTMRIVSVKKPPTDETLEIVEVRDMRRLSYIDYLVAYSDGSVVWTPVARIPNYNYHPKVQIWAEANPEKFSRLMQEQLKNGFRVSDEEFEEIERQKKIKDEKEAKKKAAQRIIVKEEPKDWEDEDDDIEIIDVIDRNVPGPAPPPRRHLSSSPEL